MPNYDYYIIRSTGEDGEPVPMGVSEADYMRCNQDNEADTQYLRRDGQWILSGLSLKSYIDDVMRSGATLRMLAEEELGRFS